MTRMSLSCLVRLSLTISRSSHAYRFVGNKLERLGHLLRVRPFLS